MFMGKIPSSREPTQYVDADDAFFLRYGLGDDGTWRLFGPINVLLLQNMSCGHDFHLLFDFSAVAYHCIRGVDLL